MVKHERSQPMKNDLLISGEAYLKTWDKKDLEAIAKYLHPEVH